jgi:hypothetical protein
MQAGAGGRAAARGVAGVLGDLGVDEHDAQAVVLLLICRCGRRSSSRRSGAALVRGGDATGSAADAVPRSSNRLNMIQTSYTA